MTKKNQHLVFNDGLFETTVEPIPAGVDPKTFLEHAMDNCPDCQAARARGETPQLFDVVPVKRDIIRGRRPRWRSLKRNVRR